jgi:hypothetical protein
MPADRSDRNADLRRKFTQGKLILNEQLEVAENPDIVEGLSEPDDDRRGRDDAD